MLYQALVNKIVPDLDISQNPVAFHTGRIIRKFLKRENDTFNVTDPSGDVYAVPCNMNPIDVRDIEAGEYEAADLSLMRQYFKPAPVILEIGSNIGYIARKAFNDHLEPGGTIICAEPNPESQAALWLNKVETAKSNRQKTIKTVKVAVAGPESQGITAKFNIRPNLSSGLSDVNGMKGTHWTANVQVRSLSSMMDQYAKGSRVSLICDAEGAEIPMILGDGPAFERIDQICIELHDKRVTGRDTTHEEMVAALAKLGLKKRARERDSYFFSRQP